MVVVHGDVGVAAEERVGAVGRDHGVEGEHELGDAPVVRVFLRVAACADEHPIACVLDLEAGVAVAHLVDHPLLLLRGEPEGVDEIGVEEAAVAGVDLALDGLEEVVLGDALGEVAVGLGHEVPLQVRERRRGVLLGPHVGPDDAVALERAVGLQEHLVLEVALGGLARHVNAGAVRGELPAVVAAAQALFLVTSEVERRGAMRATGRHGGDRAAGEAHDEEVFAEEPRAVRHAVGLDLAGEDGGDPVTAHEIAHRGTCAHLRQQFVVGR